MTVAPSKKPRIKKGTRRQFDAAFDPVAKEIGHLIRNWNHLHEQLVTIFALVLTPDNMGVPLAVWHTQQSDFQQREMLRAALKKWYKSDDRFKNCLSFTDETLWLLNECENTLRDRRNNVMHTPLNILMNCDTFEFFVEPNDFQQHKRAVKMKNEDLLPYIKHLRESTLLLSTYAIAIWVNMRMNRPLPQRPKLPAVAASRCRKAQVR